MINLVCACNLNKAIGKNNKLLYNISADLKRFKELTVGNFVVFGRKTYESLPIRPLPNRTNVVLTSDVNYNKSKTNLLVETSVERILNYYLNTGSQEKNLIIAGGQGVYESFLPYADNIYLTLIEDYMEGDSFFPLEKVNSQFKVVSREKKFDEESGLYYSFLNYERK